MRHLPVCLALTALLTLNGCAWLGMGGDKKSELPEPPPTPDPLPIDKDEVANINFQLGVHYLQAGHLRVAQGKLDKAIANNDQRADLHNVAGIVHEAMGNNDLADRHYRRALELQSDFDLARANYGHFLCQRGRREEGEVLLKQAIASNRLDNTELATVPLAACARIAGDFDTAEARLAVIASSGATPSPRLLLEQAALAHARRRNNDALRFLQQYHALVPFSAASLALAHDIETALGNQAQARSYAAQLAAKFGESAEARSMFKTSR